MRIVLGLAFAGLLAIHSTVLHAASILVYHYSADLTASDWSASSALSKNRQRVRAFIIVNQNTNDYTTITCYEENGQKFYTADSAYRPFSQAFVTVDSRGNDNQVLSLEGPGVQWGIGDNFAQLDTLRGRTKRLSYRIAGYPLVLNDIATSLKGKRRYEEVEKNPDQRRYIEKGSVKMRLDKVRSILANDPDDGGTLVHGRSVVMGYLNSKGFQSDNPATFLLFPSSQSAPSGSGTYTTAITSDTSWTWSSDAGWLTSAEATPQTEDNLEFIYNVTENVDAAPRTGLLTFDAGGETQTLTVNQAGKSATLAISPAAEAPPSGSGTYITAVTSDTTWTWRSNAAWLTSIEPTPQTGDNPFFGYELAENTDTSSRTGVLTFNAGGLTQKLTVTQAGNSTVLNVSPSAKSAPPESATFTTAISSDTTWSWSSDAAWLTSPENVSQTGNNPSFSYTVAENPFPSFRTGTITFTGGGLTRTLVVTQSIATEAPPDTVVMELTKVDFEKNAADKRGGSVYGEVVDRYYIGKFEVTNSQYATFLNKVAKTDPHALYNSLMATTPQGGIIRTGIIGSYTYAVKVDMGNKPVNYVSFWDACRFCNWLHNLNCNAPQSAASTETGVYDLTDPSALTNNTVTRAEDARYFLPRENEWYKAAYYDPVNAGADEELTPDYWLYPTQSDTTPTEASADATGDVTNPGANVVNYNRQADWNDQDGNVTTVGSTETASFYGAFDMAGNISEWNETVIESDFRGIRGGSWATPANRLQSAFRDRKIPASESNKDGFRIAFRFMQFVAVEDLNNSADAQIMEDATSGYGSVAEPYGIGKYEVTNAQYAAFLNAVAATGDDNNLFNLAMQNDARGGITRRLIAGTFCYTVKADMGNKPVNYVSFWDACRFCNWLHNEMPVGEQDPTTTEDGAYDLTIAGAITGNTVSRKAGAAYFIPSENEWYKAAYHDPEDSAADGNGTFDYWLYGTQGETAPEEATVDPEGNGDVTNPGPNVANYNKAADWNDEDGNVTTVNSAGATSHYGAYHMAGNVSEWTEGIPTSTGQRVLRGGSWESPESELRSSYRLGVAPTVESSQKGFRVGFPIPASP